MKKDYILVYRDVPNLVSDKGIKEETWFVVRLEDIKSFGSHWNYTPSHWVKLKTGETVYLNETEYSELVKLVVENPNA